MIIEVNTCITHSDCSSSTYTAAYVTSAFNIGCKHYSSFVK